MTVTEHKDAYIKELAEERYQLTQQNDALRVELSEAKETIAKREKMLNHGFACAVQDKFLIDDLRDELTEARTKIQKLEVWKSQAVSAMQRVIDEDYERPVKKRWRKDGIPSKHDECPHELPMWQDCGLCMDVAIAEILAEALAYGEVTDNTPVYPLD